MSHATLYFGVPPAQSKSASEGVKALGLNLLRASPSEINPVVTLDYIQPGHSVYKDFMAVYIQSSIKETPLSSRNPPYHPLASKTIDSTVRYPDLIWSYNQSLNSEKIGELKATLGANETKINNKVAFEMLITQDSFSKLQAHPLRPNPNTPTGTKHVNIQGFKYYLYLHRLFDAFCRTNQYPGFKTNDKSDVGWSKLWMMLDGTEKPTECEYQGYLRLALYKPSSLTLIRTDGKAAKAHIMDASYSDANFVIYGNTSVKFANFKYEYEHDADFPTGFTYLLCPFEPLLTKTDYSVVPRVVQRFFMGTLGISADIAASTFLDLKSAWGNMCKTPWGDILAHKFRCIELALMTQTSLRLLKSVAVYRGCIFVGGLYTLTLNDISYKPVDRTEILKAVKNASPHAASLVYIFDKISYSSAVERDNARNACTTVGDVNKQIRTRGIIEAERSEIRRRAYHLNFPGDGQFLAPSAYNIAKVFEGMVADPPPIFPVHPEAVDAVTLEERLLSAFGAGVPTFLVANGKKMSLEGNFFVRDREANTNNLVNRPVSKIACTLAPLKVAYADFLKMKDMKAVLNPFGAQIGNSNANKAITRAFEKESATEVITALRKAVGASAVVVENANKRKAQEDIDDRDSKNLALGYF